MVYSCPKCTDLSGFKDALDFFAETALCGVVGSFLLDKLPKSDSCFAFKHHYINHTADSEILCEMLEAMSEKKAVTITNLSRRTGRESIHEIVPLRIFQSCRGGRLYVVGYNLHFKVFSSYRLDYITKLKAGGQQENFDSLRTELGKLQKHMWGVACGEKNQLHHMEFTVSVDKGEEYIVKRIEREKRCGTVTRIDEGTYKFSADVADVNEALTWIRSFICRIKSVNFSDKSAEKTFLDDLENMYLLYGLED